MDSDPKSVNMKENLDQDSVNMTESLDTGSVNIDPDTVNMYPKMGKHIGTSTIQVKGV
jgi:hypothetical protein